MRRILAVVIGLLIATLAVVVADRSKLSKQYETAVGNLKAVESRYAGKELMNRALQLKVDQLEYMQDSLIHKMDSVRKALKVKDKDVRALQYIHSVIYKTDTLQLTDTIFRSPDFILDTIIGDAWYKTEVSMKYPGFISLSPEFTSKKYVVVSSKRETIDPPKKFFLLRWFQKKHTVIKIDVVEESPYVRDSVSRFIEIIK